MQSDAPLSASEAQVAALAELHQHYRRQVEAAIRAGEPRLVDELVQRHTDEALKRITHWPDPAARPDVNGPGGHRHVGEPAVRYAGPVRAGEGVRPCRP